MRKLLVALLCALLIATVAPAASGEGADDAWTQCPTSRLPSDRSEWWPDAAPLAIARQAGMDWLKAAQDTDGTWGDDPGVTAIAALALVNGGERVDHPAVARALDYVLAEAREDGSFSEGTYVHYYTSCAVMALSAAGRASDEAVVRAGVEMLVREQCDGDEEGFEEWWRGGIGYGGDGRPDMSNTQFALMALVAAESAYPSVDVPAATWTGALVFLHRSMNLPSVNDLAWDDAPAAPSFGDGGFVYYPGSSKAGGTLSYGSMTAAGLWCLLAAGETTSSEAASAALSWLGEKMAVTENPGFGQAAYYYYSWALARALRTAGASALLAPDGRVVAWAKELATAVLARQDASGRWANVESEFYWEGRPEVATIFALLAIEAMMPPDAGLQVRAPDGGSITITDAVGRSNGETPGFFRSQDGTVGVTRAANGPYTVEVRDGRTAEVASAVGGTAHLWREVALGPAGGAFMAEVAPIFGPASLVLGEVTQLTTESVADGMAVVSGLAIATVVAVAAFAWRRRASP